MKKLILLCAFFLTAFHTNAQTFGTENWNNMLCTLDGQKVVLSFFIFPNQKIKGEYFYKEKGIKKPVTGFFRRGEIHLFGADSTAFKIVADYERTGYNPTGIFNNMPRFEGSYTNGSARTTAAVVYYLSDVSKGTFRERYPRYHFSDTEIETFASNIVKAFLAGDKEWIANHCRFGRPFGYELTVCTEAGSQTNVRSKAQLFQLYPLIVTEKFKAGMNEIRTRNLNYTNDGIIILGGGHSQTDYITIYDYFDSSANKYKLYMGSIEGGY